MKGDDKSRQSCRWHIERRLLQIAIGLGCLVPILAGGSGVLSGLAFLGEPAAPADLDSHFRYLSGLLFAIGLGYASAIPDIERKSGRILLLGAIVVTGGFGRALSLLEAGLPSPGMQAALTMELLVVPALTLWQRRLVRRALMSG